MNTLVTRARRHLAAVAALALAGSLASCAALSPGSDSTAAASGAGPTAAPSGALTVSTSFYPIQYLAQAIGGEHVAVTSVTPTNVEPHDFELSPKDVTALSASSLVLYVSGFQPSLDDALAQVSGPAVVDLAGSVDLVHHDGVEEEHEEGATEAAHDHDHDLRAHSICTARATPTPLSSSWPGRSAAPPRPRRSPAPGFWRCPRRGAPGRAHDGDPPRSGCSTPSWSIRSWTPRMRRRSRVRRRRPPTAPSTAWWPTASCASPWCASGTGSGSRRR